MEEITMKVDRLEALVQGITGTEVSDSKMEEVSEDLLSILGDISTLDGKSDSHKKLLSKIEKCAVNLWNVAVARKAGGSLSTMMNARLRHIACNLVYVSNTTQGEESSLKKQTMMALKTIRAWLDAGNPSMCENPTSMAEDCIRKRAEIVLSHMGSGDAESAIFIEKKQEVDRDLFKLLCYKAEIAFNQEECEKSVQFIQQAKEVLPKLPEEGGFLSLLCYNFGVETFEKKQFQRSVQFLRDSFELGKGKTNVGPKKQARTLRLLAHGYLEWDSDQHWQKALNAVGLANAEHPDPVGLYLKIRIMLVGEESDERLKMGLFDLLKHPELNLDLGLNTVRMVIQKDRKAVAFEGLRQLAQRNQHSPELGRVSVTHLELLLQVNEYTQAKELVEQIIMGSNCGQSLDVSMKKRIHLLLWEQAAAAFETQRYDEALEWYDYSLSLYTNQDEQDSNLAKLHRNRASCLISLNKLEQAEESIAKAENCDKTSPFVFYIKYKLAVMKGQDEEAIECLQKMACCTPDATKTTEEESTVHGLICLAAQMAFEQSRRAVAVRALERLVEHSPDNQQVLTALRCLIRFKLTIQEESLEPVDHKKELEILNMYIKGAYEKLILLSESHQEGVSSMLHNEATWFMKIAWNMALKSEDSFKHMQEFFILCSKLQMLCGLDSAGLSRHKTCLLMAAAATLQVAKATTDELDKRESLKQCLQFVEECRSVLTRIQDSSLHNTDQADGEYKTSVFLILYEFEAKLMLGDVDEEQVLEKALTLPKIEPNVFENIAALAMDGPWQKKGLASRALKVAIKKHLQTPSVDYTKCSKAFHSLIQLALQSGCQTDSVTKEEAWAYYLDLIDIIEQKAQGQYPELEILWLMTKSWNCGIYLYSAANNKDALRWCELSMRLLNHLGTLKVNYEKQMTEVYGEILAKMNSSSDNIPVTSL